MFKQGNIISSKVFRALAGVFCIFIWSKSVTAQVVVTSFTADSSWGIQLEWKTSSERNQGWGRFEIHRSLNENTGYTRVGTISGREVGDYSGTTIYRWNDTTATLYDSTYWYKLYSIGFSGDTLVFHGIVSATIKADTTSPVHLDGAIPCPYYIGKHELILFRYALRDTVRISLVVREITTGDTIRLLVDEVQNTGTYRIEWEVRDEDGFQVPEGIYEYVFTSPDTQIVKQLQIIDTLIDAPDSLSLTTNGAEYLIITPNIFCSQVYNGLATWRSNNGLDVDVIRLPLIEKEFAENTTIDTAIKNFFDFVYHNWSKVPTYAVLIGDMEFVPTHMMIARGDTFECDNWLVEVEGEEYIPEFAIGRLPVDTRLELSRVLDKIISYETNTIPHNWRNDLLFIADDEDPDGPIFMYYTEQLIDSIPSTYTISRVYSSDTSIYHGDRDSIIKQIDEGCLVVHYFGHGSWCQLAHERLFFIWDIYSLNNPDKLPIVFFPTICYNDFAERDGMAEVFVTVEEKGAIASWTCAAPAILFPYLSQKFFHYLLSEQYNVLGDVILRTFSFTSGRNAFYMILMGDPALKIPLSTAFGSISGTIRSSNGEIFTACVRAFGGNVIGEKELYFTGDSVYTYVMTDLPLTPLDTTYYYVEVIAQGFVHEYYDNARDITNATPVEVLGGRNTPNIDFILEEAESTGVISGTIVDAVTGEPIPLSIVMAVPSGESKIASITVADTTGAYIFSDLIEGTEYYVFASADGYIGEFYNNAYASESATLIRATSPNIDFELDPAEKTGLGGIAGKISADRKIISVEGCMVYIYEGTKIVSSTRTNATGNYSVFGLEPGTYTVRASMPSYSTKDYSASVAVNNDTILGINIELKKAGAEEKEESSVFWVSQPMPNITKGPVAIKYSFPGKISGSLKIYNITGRLVKSISLPAGKKVVTWNLRSDKGINVPTGIYFLKVTLGKFKKTMKVMVIR